MSYGFSPTKYKKSHSKNKINEAKHALNNQHINKSAHPSHSKETLLTRLFQPKKRISIWLNGVFCGAILFIITLLIVVAIYRSFPEVYISPFNYGEVKVGDAMDFPINLDIMPVYLDDLTTDSIILDENLFAQVSIEKFESEYYVTLYNVWGTEGFHYITLKESSLSALLRGNPAHTTICTFYLSADGNSMLSDFESPMLVLSKPYYTDSGMAHRLFFDESIDPASISIDESNIKLYGFDADIQVTGEGLSRTICLTDFRNFPDDSGSYYLFTIDAGIAMDFSGNYTSMIQTPVCYYAG